MNTPSYFCMDNFTTKDGVGFAQVEESYNISLYPNPTHNTLNIDLKDLGVQEIQIYDINARLIRDIKDVNPQIQLSVEELKNGLYFVQFITNKGVVSKKFIKQ